MIIGNHGNILTLHNLFLKLTQDSTIESILAFQCPIILKYSNTFFLLLLFNYFAYLGQSIMFKNFKSQGKPERGPKFESHD